MGSDKCTQLPCNNGCMRLLGGLNVVLELGNGMIKAMKGGYRNGR